MKIEECWHKLQLRLSDVCMTGIPNLNNFQLREMNLLEVHDGDSGCSKYEVWSESSSTDKIKKSKRYWMKNHYRPHSILLNLYSFVSDIAMIELEVFFWNPFSVTIVFSLMLSSNSEQCHIGQFFSLGSRKMLLGVIFSVLSFNLSNCSIILGI